ncbi:MAG: iron-sulfur cluster-binding protein [Chloroflexi bacterium]|nr:iron-sulfur cluster-binding protein [Chloroflexota bacterium]
MKVRTDEFKARSAETTRNPRRQASLKMVYDGLHKGRIAAAEDTHGWDDERDRARAIKWHTINNLDYYLDLLDKNVRANGGNVFFANDDAEAREYVLGVAKANNVKTVIKSKSMVSEEIGLNEAFEKAGINPVETDLGEYIIQLAKEAPYHLIAPAIHKTREEISDLIQEVAGGPHQEDPKDLTDTARALLRDAFRKAEMGVSGVNFAVAETGSIAIVTNEGNGRMVTSAPRVHVAIVGMEKVIPSMQDLSTMLRVLIRSATGQRISSYVTVVNGPRKAPEEDGPDEFHLVIVNNGRENLLKDEQLREAMLCLRCGACLNACPVYRKAGGHAYGWVYPGPIGAIVSPVMTGKKAGRDLPFASTLCGACKDACPVKIELPSLLLRLRSDLSEGKTDPKEASSPLAERLSIKVWRFGVQSPAMFSLAGKLSSLLMAPMSRQGWVRWLPPPLNGWTKSREFPRIASKPFRARFKKKEQR